MADIAERVGVTQATVSMVLNKSRSSVRISDTTRKKILRAAEELNYSPSFHARALAKGRTFVFGLIVGEIQSPHFSELSSLAMEVAESHGYHLLLSVTQWSYEKELECLDMLLQHRVDGIIFGSGALRPGTRQYEYITSQKYPIVILGPHSENFSIVQSDWDPGMDQAIAYLKDKGHGRIGYIYDPGIDKSQDSKRQSFEAACLRHGLTWEYFGCPPQITDARRLGVDLARRPDRPGAILVQSDFLTTGFMRGLYDRGVQVPRDIAVVGCDGTAAGEYFLPPITSIAQDRLELMTRGINVLLEMIEHRDLPRREILVPTKLIARDSA